MSRRTWRQRRNATFQMIQIGVLRSLALLKMARIDEALALLDQIVALATPGGWISPFMEAGPPMAELLNGLIRKGVSVDHVGRLLTAFENGKQVAAPDGQATPAPSLEAPHPITPSPILAGLPPLAERLTNREMEILKLLAQRLQNKEIAERLSISPTTVKSHVNNIYQKLSVGNRREAVVQAKALNILPAR